MTDLTIDNRMARYHNNQQRRGLIQVKIWIPGEQAHKFKRMAELARLKHHKKTLN